MPASPPVKPLILIFSLSYIPFVSGAERFVIEIVKRLTSRYTFVILTARFDRALPRDEMIDGIRVMRLGVGQPFDKYVYPFIAPLVALRFKADAVHAVMESFAGIALGIYRVLRPRLPTLLTLQSGTLEAERVTSTVPQWLIGWIHTSPRAIQAISEALAARAKKLGAKDVVVIPNGVDLQPFFAARGIPKRDELILAIGRLHVDKGFDVLIRAFALLAKDRPEMRLEIGGHGDERERLQRLIEEHDLADRVTLLGAIPYADVPQRMAQATLFVSPSRVEGMGNVFVEAQAAGTAVIGSTTGGIPDIIENGITGLTVPVEDAQATADAMARLLDNPQERERMIAAAKRRLVRYDWDRIAQDIEALYARVFFSHVS